MNIVIPLCNGGGVFNQTIPYTRQAIGHLRTLMRHVRVTVTIVDDGSVPAYRLPADMTDPDWSVLRLPENRGRAFARQTGLQAGRASRYTVFVDADIVLYPHALCDFIRTLEQASSLQAPCMVYGLFHFTDDSLFTQTSPDFSVCNDVRLDGGHLKCRVDAQAGFAATGYYGPWSLPNMLLGGFFGVSTAYACAQDTGDPRFDAQGYEKASLVTRLLSMKNIAVIPVPGGFSKHIESRHASALRRVKERVFRQAFARWLNPLVEASHTTIPSAND